MKTKLLTILLMTGPLLPMAQTPEGLIIATAASGGNNTDVTLGGEAVNVNWTIGQVVIDPAANINDGQTIGFNQGFNCEWYGIDTVWTAVTDDQGNILWYEATGTTGPNPHFFESPWCITSVEEIGVQAGETGVNVYPNPAADQLTVELTQWDANTSIQLYDLNGRMLLTTAANGRRTSLDLNKIASGIYVLSINNSNGEPISSHRIIRQ